MDYYLTLKRNRLSNYERTWRNLECILLSEGGHSEKAAYFILRRDAPETSGDDDIIKEANRIIERTLPASRRRERRRERMKRLLLSLAFFLSGAVAGAIPLLIILIAR